MATLKNAFGSVSPYTRHIISCVYRDETSHNSCGCPKWLYINQRGESPRRKSLITPSWSEAQRIAADTLRGFDPEIAESREAKKAKKASLLTFDAAIKLWEHRPNGGKEKYPWLTSSLKVWAEAKGMMHVQDVTTLALEKWSTSKMWTDYKDTTRAQRWGIMRSFFGYLFECKAIKDNPILPIRAVRVSRDHVQGPYTDTQIKAIFDSVDRATADREWRSEVDRIRLFMELLLNTGCDVVDAVLFQPRNIKDMKAGIETVSVYRYKRRKTGVDAVIPLKPDLASRFRTIPLAPGFSEGMPFRGQDPDMHCSTEYWIRRIKAVIDYAGVKAVTLPGLDSNGMERKRRANVKQFRHTFAVKQLRAGNGPDQVATLMGHIDGTMVRQHYAPWVAELDEAFILQVTKHW